jgi:hypothetical protein
MTTPFVVLLLVILAVILLGACEQGPGGEWTDVWEFHPTKAGQKVLEARA